jgi:hypothetical protein
MNIVWQEIYAYQRLPCQLGPESYAGILIPSRGVQAAFEVSIWNALCLFQYRGKHQEVADS